MHFLSFDSLWSRSTCLITFQPDTDKETATWVIFHYHERSIKEKKEAQKACRGLQKHLLLPGKVKYLENTPQETEAPPGASQDHFFLRS